MKNEKSHTLLKSSILFEMHGEKLYLEAAEKAQNTEVKDFFKKMANDEHLHAEILREVFDSYHQGTKYIPHTNTWFTTNKVEEIRNPLLVELITGSSFEAAAITAAILMEEKSVIEYQKMADEAEDSEEKKLFNWLVKWEQEHVQRLSVLRDGLKIKTLITERLETF